MSDGILKETITDTNLYDLLPDYLGVVIEKSSIPENEVLDMCLAICAADKNVGTNRMELSIDKFFGLSADATWRDILSKLGVSHISGSEKCLPRVQRERIIVDTMIMCLRLKNYKISCSYNSEASKKVSTILGITNATGTLDDKSEQDIVESLRKIQQLFDTGVCSEDTGSDSFQVAQELLSQLSKWNKFLLELAVPEQISVYFGSLKFDICEEMKKNTELLVFNAKDLEKLNMAEKSFVEKYFVVSNDEKAQKQFIEGINRYKAVWVSSLVQLSYSLADLAFKESPSVTVAKLDSMITLSPICVGLEEIRVFENCYADSIVYERLSSIYKDDSMHQFKDESAEQIFALITLLINKRPVNSEIIKKYSK